jgi:hypothetical protein
MGILLLVVVVSLAALGCPDPTAAAEEMTDVIRSHLEQIGTIPPGGHPVGLAQVE